MPGYGTKGPTEGRGLLPWSWAEERLTASHDYWVATARPDGRPHLMPVWAVWDGGALWWSSSLGSSKARNIAADPRCMIATDNPWEPVVLEDTAERVTDHDALARFIALENDKYRTRLRRRLSRSDSECHVPGRAVLGVQPQRGRLRGVADALVVRTLEPRR
jgi:hypothetical protein